jgi:ABC-type phosphate/phosphonate transport system substrate-binding protein
VLAATPPSPSIPFVTSCATPQGLREQLQAALHAVARDRAWMDVRAGLMLRDIAPVELASYAVQLAYEREAAELGYPRLR